MAGCSEPFVFFRGKNPRTPPWYQIIEMYQYLQLNIPTLKYFHPIFFYYKPIDKVGYYYEDSTILRFINTLYYLLRTN
jgi:hypothetical protein